MADHYGIDFSDLDLDWLESLDRPGSRVSSEPASDKQSSFFTPDLQSTEPEAAPSPQPSARKAAVPSEDSVPRQESGVSAGDHASRQAYEARRAAASRPAGSRASAQRQAPVRRIEPERASAPVRSSGGRNTPPPDSGRGGRRRSRGGAGGKLLIALIVVLVLGMAFAGWQLSSIFRNYKRDRSAYEEIAARAIIPVSEPDDEEDLPDEPSQSAASVVSEIPFAVDWEHLRSINSDIVGWLYCPDTVINYPVVQSSDMSFYLNHGFDGNSNTAGTLFADYSSVLGIEQSNYIIYGHNMKNESMFGTFKNYVNRSYYEEHPVMYYLTPTGSYRIDLICAHIAESLVDNLPGYFSSLTAYQSYLNTITSDAFWVNYDAVTTDLQLFSMSTCTSAAGFDDARLLLFGVMVPIQ